MKSVLAVRQDNNGDAILAGPAIRALAAGADSVTLLCGPRGSAAAQLLPGVEATIVWEAPWIDARPKPTDPVDVARLVMRLQARAFNEAVIFTSFHQSPLPTALLLRLAGIRKVGAISVDYPGSLLDVRHSVDENIHEVERALSLAAAMGYHLPADDDRRLQLLARDSADEPLPQAPYVVVHAGCTVPARTWSELRWAQLLPLLTTRGWNVVLTGVAAERAQIRRIGARRKNVVDLAGRTSFSQFVRVVRGATAVVSGNTVAPHVAAAVRTPVVSIFPPTIPAMRFRPWMVDHVILGDQAAPCANCRAHVCPIEGQPCLADVTPEAVVEAIESLVGRRAIELAS